MIVGQIYQFRIQTKQPWFLTRTAEEAQSGIPSVTDENITRYLGSIFTLISKEDAHVEYNEFLIGILLDNKIRYTVISDGWFYKLTTKVMEE